MPAVYQVVAECAHVTVSSPSGRVQTLLLKGALVPADAPELGRLLSIGYVANTSPDETGGVDANGVPAAAYTADVPAPVTSTPVEVEGGTVADGSGGSVVDPEVAERRAAARSKLPSDGSAPDGRAAKDVLVEWLTDKGYSYDELAKHEKSELVDLVKQPS
jgi:hypothetical protein